MDKPLPSVLRLHASCVASGERAILLLGASGAGKSDLALRLIDAQGFGTAGSPKCCQLVSDDQVIVEATSHGLLASAPQGIAGLLEIRGIGLVSLPVAEPALLNLVVVLQDHHLIERLPEPEFWPALGWQVPLLRLDPWQASAPARVRAALDLQMTPFQA